GSWNYYELSLCATALGGATAPSAPRSRPLPHLRASEDGGSKGGHPPLAGVQGRGVPGGGPGAAPPALSQPPPHRIPELHRILATSALRHPAPPYPPSPDSPPIGSPKWTDTTAGHRTGQRERGAYGRQ